MYVRRSHPAEAAAALAASVAAYPCNRDAWVALAKLVQGNADIPASAVALPQHWMRDAHLVSLALDAQENAEALSRLQVSECVFVRACMRACV